MTRRQALAVLALFVTLVGCDKAAMIKKYAPLQDEPIARKYLDLLQTGNVDEIQKDLDPSIKDTDSREKLSLLADLLLPNSPKVSKLSGHIPLRQM